MADTQTKADETARYVEDITDQSDDFSRWYNDVVRRAAGLFDRLVIAVAVAHHKKTLFSLEQRVAQVKAATEGIADVSVLPFDGLIMDFCAAQKASAVSFQH